MNLRDDLQKKYVAYIDVLGFKELVGGQKIDSLETYFNTIIETLDLIRDDKGKISSLLISDSVILISPDTPTDFRTLLQAVQTIQAKLVQKDIWMRGAISFGDVFFEQELNLVVGTGLVRAYQLESEAIYPRVIIDTSIIPRIAENRRAFYRYVNPDPNNFTNDKLKLIQDYHEYTEADSFFISYAHRVILDLIDGENIHLIYEIIKKNLYSDPKNYKKFLWVNKYFSEVLALLMHQWSDLIKISPSEREKVKYISKWWEKFIDL